MAVIDTFLTLLVNQKADRLAVTSGDVPTLFKEDGPTRLSMPAISREMVEVFALEVIGGDRSDEIVAGARFEGVYRTASGDEFGYLIRVRTGGCEIEMRPSVASPPADEAPPAASDGDPPASPEDQASEERITAAVERSLDVQKRSAAGDPVPATSRRRGAEAPAPDGAIIDVLEQAIRAGASDVFLSSGRPPRIRVDGTILPVEAAATSRAQLEGLLGEREGAELDATGSVDLGATWAMTPSPGAAEGRRFRINVFRHSNGLGAAIRPVQARIPTLGELNLPRDLYALCDYPSGLVLLTGASGSGKSSTLAALIEHINQSRSRHIITIEDPIEFEHGSRRSLIHQREVPRHAESFSAGLRAALRENPDVILLGEMRDPATISAALTASETGHLVFSTLHTGNAASAVSRIIDGFPGHQQVHVRLQVASSLRAVVAQRLIPSDVTRGRIPALETLIVTPAVRTQIREGREHQLRTAIQTGGDDGMITLERSLAALVRSGKIRRGTAMKHAEDPHALGKLLGG